MENSTGDPLVAPTDARRPAVGTEWPMTKKLFVSFLAAFLLAGCLHGEPKEHKTVPAAGLMTMDLSDCRGFFASSQPIPPGMAPGTPPPGWEPKKQTDWSTVQVGGAECNRFHVGPFERGPIRFVWGGHLNADIPRNCNPHNNLDYDPSALSILNIFIIDDSEIAAFLKEDYAMPALYSEIQADEQASGPNVQRTWKWAQEGQGASHLTLTDDGLAGRYAHDERFWWVKGTGMAQLDFDFSYKRTGPLVVEGRPAYGVLHAPMLVPPPNGEFVGSASYYPSMTGEGKFTFFSDRLCEHHL